MKSILLVIAASIILFSCETKAKETPTDVTPKPLKEKAISDISISKRGADDLVESLYDDLKKDNPQLKELGDLISDLQDHREDSLQVFRNFDEKNDSYYSAAKTHLQAITDSSLKKSMDELISTSQTNYDNKIQSQKDLIKTIYAKNTKINDLLIILKITKTLPVIHSYQQTFKTQVAPMENISKESDLIVSKEEKLIKN